MCPSDFERRERERHRDAPPLFLGIEVGDRRAVLDPAEPVGGAGREQQRLGQGRLARRRRGRPGRRCGSWPSGRSSPRTPLSRSVSPGRSGSPTAGKGSLRMPLRACHRLRVHPWYPRPRRSRTRALAVRARDIRARWVATGCPISTSSRELEETACSTGAGAAVSSGASAPSATGCDASASVRMRSRCSVWSHPRSPRC